jgi:hypothetical protein
VGRKTASVETEFSVPATDDDAYASTIPDSVEGYGEVLYYSGDDSHIGQQRHEVEFDVSLGGDNDFDLDLDLDEDIDGLAGIAELLQMRWSH